MFWNKKPSTVKQTLTLKHRNGENITITVEGTNINHTAYVVGRIKELFNMSPHNKTLTQEEMDKFWDEAEKLFGQFGDMFKH
jgi:hypothetical protein